MKTQTVNAGSHTMKQKEACVQNTRCQMGSGRHGGLNFKLSVEGDSEGSVFLKLIMCLRSALTQSMLSDNLMPQLLPFLKTSHKFLSKLLKFHGK